MEEESVFEVLKLNSAIKLKQFIKNNPDCLKETYDDYDDRNVIHFSNAEQTEILIKAGLSLYSPDKEGVPGALSPIVFSTEELEKIENESVILPSLVDEALRGMHYITSIILDK